MRRMPYARSLAITCLAYLILLPQISSANEQVTQKNGVSKADMSYIGLSLNFNQFKSILLPLAEINANGSEGTIFSNEFPLTAHTYGASFILGSYITDHIKTEIRYGKGLVSDDLSGKSLDVNLGDWFAWYMGALYPITSYANVYAQFGLSLFNAEVTRYERIKIKPGDGRTTSDKPVRAMPSSVEMEEELFGEHFSTSWILGIDFRVMQDTYWSFEYGRLLNDADSGIKVYQFNTALKYEF